ncbi:metal ABC transporter solute-binding protein, Zn/Mn family, partial [Staphylococcus hominis]|uniref:metal ABC transporter solute-binding protein, Zn/Mn family n=1 Tax=Staphylococcus hominis TaxID=1290 RepID=UPI00164378BB
DLDKDIKRPLKLQEPKTLYISHHSIPYLPHPYPFNQQPIQNINPQQPTQKHLTTILKQIKHHNVNYILPQENLSNKVPHTLTKQTH